VSIADDERVAWMWTSAGYGTALDARPWISHRKPRRGWTGGDPACGLRATSEGASLNEAICWGAPGPSNGAPLPYGQLEPRFWSRSAVALTV
jgi:hypothetical protein